MGPVNGCSHAVAGTGRLVAVSGQLPVDDAGAIVDADDALIQARQVFANLTRALGAAGAKPSDVIRLTCFLTDLADLGSVRRASRGLGSRSTRLQCPMSDIRPAQRPPAD
ncbi:RidA family protein [Nocardioides astragali]|uniref:RidA family protein n=1 Tax=Nocardioides astragali TaxID=1776736 RepID=UPI003556C595